MKSILLVLCFFVSATQAAVSADSDVKPLSAAAEIMSGHLPKGCIVTAEKVGGTVEFACAGDTKPDGVAPSKVLFEIGSLTKVFTALLLARAVTEGVVTLDTTVGQILEDHPFADSRIGKITLLQLATHTSGLPADADNLQEISSPSNAYAQYDRRHLFEFLSKVKLKGNLPFRRRYSNLAMGLLGTLLALRYDEPWDKLVAEKITQPLGNERYEDAANSRAERKVCPSVSRNTIRNAMGVQGTCGSGGSQIYCCGPCSIWRGIVAPRQDPVKG